MNKTSSVYIFMTFTIMNVGGSPIYIRNKMNYLKNEGWDVLVISSYEGKVLIEDLKQFEPYILKELVFQPYLYSKKEQEKILSKLRAWMPKRGEYQRIIIESNTMQIALWAELMSKELSAQHLIFSLQEIIAITSKGELDFLTYKYHRHELATIKKGQLKDLFSPYFDIEEDKSYFLAAHCSNPVEDIKSTQWDNLPFSDYTLGSIGRIAKPFIQTVINDIYTFANTYPNKTFKVIFIGGEPQNSHVELQIRKKFKYCPNVKVYITGYIYPIPLNLLRKIDVFMSSAGSVRVSSRLGLPTISYDANDLQPIGIFGYTTNNTLFRNEEIIVSGTELLTEILINKSVDIQEQPNVPPVHFDFSPHIEFINNGPKDNNYYDFTIYPLSFKERQKVLIHKLFGSHFFEIFSNIKNRLLTNMKQFIMKIRN